MKIAIRVDSSTLIGSGHVMRTMTLAGELRERGNDVIFVCRPHPGNIIEVIRSEGFRVKVLPEIDEAYMPELHDIKHASWLAVDWEIDAEQTANQIISENVDWIIVDHYALDERWHKYIRMYVDHIMVIDDLADRKIDCDILLDQNLFKDMEMRYRDLFASSGVRLLGPEFAMLRPEFREARSRALVRGQGVKRIFVFFGGADPTNETTKVINALSNSAFRDVVIDVVVGNSNPQNHHIQQLCKKRENLNYYCQVSNMGELMLAADLCLGACGVNTWERCAVMLPAIAVAVAFNQIEIAEAVNDAGAIEYLGWAEAVSENDWQKATLNLMGDVPKLKSISQICGELVDCNGVFRVVDRMMEA